MGRTRDKPTTQRKTARPLIVRRGMITWMRVSPKPQTRNYPQNNASTRDAASSLDWLGILKDPKAMGGGRELPKAGAIRSVRAARKQRNQNHQVRQRKQPLLRLGSGRFRCPCNNTQVAGPREIMNVLHTDTRQAGYLRIRKYFLARLYSNQRGLTFAPPNLSTSVMFHAG